MKNFEELLQIKKEIEEQLLKLKEVNGVDIDRGISEEAKIIVYVENKSEFLAKQIIPKKIKGVNVDVVERRFVLHSD